MTRSSLLKVRQTTAALRAALLNPSAEGARESLAAQMPDLHLAAQTLANLRNQSPDPASRQDLAELARDLNACARLIQQGLVIAQGIARLLAPASATYRPGGEPAPLPTGTSLMVRG